MSFFGNRLENKAGLDTLEDPIADDINVLEHLLNWTINAAENKVNEQSFLLKSRGVLESLQNYYNKPKKCGTVVSLPRLREFLSFIAETLYVTVSCNICKHASESLVKIPAKIVGQINDLNSRLKAVHDLLFDMHPLKTDNFNSMDTIGQNRTFSQEKYMSEMKKLKHLQNQLEGCQVMVCIVVKAVEDKCRRENTFFNTVSLSIGAVCAGRLLWRLCRGDGLEELLYSGLWATSTGLSAVVLQVPRVRLSDVLTQLEQQRQNKQKIDSITSNWMVSDTWSYAKLVKLPSPRTAA